MKRRVKNKRKKKNLKERDDYCCPCSILGKRDKNVTHWATKSPEFEEKIFW